jgi:hypothetical protein
MKVLKITSAAGVETLIPDNYVRGVQVTNNIITRVSYTDLAGIPVNTEVDPFNGANNKYEVGCLVPGNIFSAYVANYIVR